MTAELTLRPARPSDAPTLLALVNVYAARGLLLPRPKSACCDEIAMVRRVSVSSAANPEHPGEVRIVEGRHAKRAEEGVTHA